MKPNTNATKAQALLTIMITQPDKALPILTDLLDEIELLKHEASLILDEPLEVSDETH